MIRKSLDQLQICRKHNLVEEFANPNPQNENYLCRLCIDEFYEIIPLKQIKDINRKIIQQFNSQCKQNFTKMNLLIHSLIFLREVFSKYINNIENMINEIRKQIVDTENLLNQARQEILQKQNIKIYHEKYVQNQMNFQVKITSQIEMIKQDNGIDKMIQQLKELDLKSLNYENDQYNLVNSKKNQYQLLPESSIQFEDNCWAISINANKPQVLSGSDEKIIFFEFDNGKLKQKESIECPQYSISCLLFLKKKNQFISGGFSGKEIKIWQQNNYSQWINIETLNGHTDQLTSLIINSNENCLISGSSDKSIIFWQFSNNKWNLQQQITCFSTIWSLSLNESNSNLIACEQNKMILVLNLQQTKWVISQKINVQIQGFRLYFLSDKEFVFLPENSMQLHFYMSNGSDNIYQKVSEVQVSSGQQEISGFPIQYVKSKKLLIVKNSNYLNILKKLRNNNYILEQSIEFASQNFIGSVSEDGQFLITWDDVSRQFQIWELQQQD